MTVGLVRRIVSQWHWQSLRLGSAMPFSTANPLPATFIRGGTSKGIYLKKDDLPSDRDKWTPIFLGIMGSPDPVHARQLNGMGGGVSSLSKICVVGKPSEEQQAQGIDVEYTFCQVGIKDSSVDYSGNCGNLSSMIGVFAVDEHLCVPRIVQDGIGAVHAYNTNTSKRIDTKFPVVKDINGKFVPVLDREETTVAGVPGKASQIDLEFVDPAGARTGKLLPTQNAMDTVNISFAGTSHTIRMSLIDATNPSVFVDVHDLAAILGAPVEFGIDYSQPQVEVLVETLRQKGAELMGLDPNAKAQPKIAVLSSPDLSGTKFPVDEDADIVAHAFSMGVLHKAIPMTLGLCLGAAVGLHNSIPYRIVFSKSANDDADHLKQKQSFVRIAHPSGSVDVGAEYVDAQSTEGNASSGVLKSAKVVRTGRRLMRGEVWW